ncbi:MAG: prepilin-type N-terminal cleavage/methylation domain-containing protein [Hydrogenoanaerobacterium sp.]
MLKLQKFMKTKKGFTLVEVIVVLVILAILAAISIPSLTGYIDKAKDAALIQEGRQVYAAAQTMASMLYADGRTDDEIKSAINFGTTLNGKTLTVEGLMGYPTDNTGDANERKGTQYAFGVTNGKITTLKCYLTKDLNGKRVVFPDGTIEG